MSTNEAPKTKRKAVRAIGPRLKKLFGGVLGLTTALAVNGAYLGAVTFLEWRTGNTYQNWFYLLMFLGHVVLGLLLLVPFLVFGGVHLRNTYDRPNRRAVRAGYALLVAALVVLASGVVLLRLDGLIVIKSPTVRTGAYWAHVVAPLVVVWLYVLHRLAGPRIRWRLAIRWIAVAAVLIGAGVALQTIDPRQWGQVGNPEGAKYFEPSLARTETGDFIPARMLQDENYCRDCHADIHKSWTRSVHHFSSFNNPAYLFSVRQTRKVSMERDGNMRASRFCAGCHDPVPFFSGAFDDPKYDDEKDPTAHAGITCTACHAISNVNGVRGNGDYTIDAPVPYPFAFDDNAALRWVSRQLIKAKPAFHKKTFLKPLHKSAEFCGTCHKVFLPQEFNHYKWLRGQDSYDSFLLSGVSGHGVQSFYYPPKAQPNCNGCHMNLVASDDFGAADRDGSGTLKVHDHQFPSGNTAIPKLVGLPDADAAIAEARKALEGVARVDLFGVRRGGEIDSPLTAPLRPEVPALVPGETYLLEVVVRTTKMGHHFTQGTGDSNEIWLDVSADSAGQVVGRSGALEAGGRVDPWSHFVNAYVLDPRGHRIDRRNPEDIFVPLYDHQIPPGAADVVHYRFTVPADAHDALAVRVKLQYRKFDRTYMQYVYGPDFVNDLPVVTVAEDQITFPVAGGGSVANAARDIPPWERWNDYGIGLLLKGDRRQLKQAEEAFAQVEKLGRVDGALNLARVYLADGRVQTDAPEALARARKFTDPAANAWTLLWLGALVDEQNGRYDEALTSLKQIVDGGFPQAQGRGFDFSLDYRLLDEIGQVLYLSGLQAPAGSDQRTTRLTEAASWFERALALDPENLPAHWALKQIDQALGRTAEAEQHAALHAKYKPDDNARDQATLAARRADPAADHAADAVVVYDLQRH